ncbi:hypothetical protein C8P63_11063 [Melghirimyces profundicolus]|uniref:Uncharacterized protein n=1 Tax=Melghirimyces profundicolus TaxID=1242148 RepID=A0A2T6BV15_9BACL|nr:hypothetical protein [Melghirimyces profundicolus]PTX59918.1 hypothetical protein C8P63_11063 [Melghirimyces profundicolus]
MRGRAARLAMEMGFVLASVAALKEWVFPFFIWQWFPAADTASAMLEWILIVVGVITCFLYLGLGSSSKYIYGLAPVSSLGVFLAVHLPLLLPLLLRENSHAWWWHRIPAAWGALIGDGVELFTPDRWEMDPLSVSAFSCLLFLMGRWVKVEGEERVRRIGTPRGGWPDPDRKTFGKDSAP